MEGWHYGVSSKFSWHYGVSGVSGIWRFWQFDFLGIRSISGSPNKIFSDQEKKILFGDPEMLRMPKKSNFYLADVTFKVTPKVFFQFYSLHVSFSGLAPACLLFFLPKKEKHTIVLRSPKKPTKNLKKSLLDFEQAAPQAFRVIFQESKLSGYFLPPFLKLYEKNCGPRNKKGDRNKPRVCISTCKKYPDWISRKKTK